MHQYRGILFKSKDLDNTKRPDYSYNCSYGNTTIVDNSRGKNNTKEYRCSLSGWSWLSQAKVSLRLLFVSHSQLNESLLLDELTIFGQIGGNAGIVYST